MVSTHGGESVYERRGGVSYRRRVGSRGLGARRIVVVVKRGRKEGRLEWRAANENGDEGASVDFRRR